jgi:hypothetical protein
LELLEVNFMLEPSCGMSSEMLPNESETFSQTVSCGIEEEVNDTASPLLEV